MAIEIIFESHATSIDNENNIASGHNDSPLSSKGIIQASELGKRYEKSAICKVFCSDLRRSNATAKIAFGGRDIEIISDQRLREWDYGDLNGAPTPIVEAQKGDHISHPFPNGESLITSLDRINHFLDRALIPSNSPALIIGHRAIFYALEHRFNHRSLQELVTMPWKWQPGWKYIQL